MLKVNRYDILYIGSQSQSRHKLLLESGINFKILDHTSEESIKLSDAENFQHLVRLLAVHKMECVILPEDLPVEEGMSIFVLTADSLSRGCIGNQIFGKPRNIDHAKEMLRLEREQPIEIATGCCLEVKKFVAGEWVAEESKSWTTNAIIEFCVDEQSLESYLKNTPEALVSCGAGVIEGYGQRFLKSIDGSHSAVSGLPIFELCQALTKFGFR
jgi:septum formation protein